MLGRIFIQKFKPPEKNRSQCSGLLGKKDSGSSKDSELPPKDVTTSTPPTANSSESQENGPTDDPENTAQKVSSKENDSGASFPEVSSTPVKDAAGLESDKDVVESTHPSSVGNAQITSKETSANEENANDVKHQEDNETP